MIRALMPEQRDRAILQAPKRGNNILAQAFSDNVVLDRMRVCAFRHSRRTRKQLLDLIRLYVGNLREGQRASRCRMWRNISTTRVAFA